MISGYPISTEAGQVVTEPEVVSNFDWLLLSIYILIALLFSFLCSIAEAVLLSITPSYIEHLQVRSPKRAQALRTLRITSIDRSLAAILTLNTIAHTVGAIAAGAQATVVFGSGWIGIFSAVMTLAILFFSEIIPKTIGAVYWKPLASLTAVFVQWLITLLYPLIWVSEAITKWISHGKKQHIFSRDEFLAMAGLGERTGYIDEHEFRIVRNLFRFRKLRAKDIMTPRTVMVSMPADAKVEDVFQQVLNIRFSRIPIFREDNDDITDFVLKDDVLMTQAKSHGSRKLAALKRKLICVLGEMPLPDLMEVLLNERQHIALVVDEYGQTSGLVTLEDLVETLLGLEIMDEMDEVKDMQLLARQQWRKRAEKRGLIIDKDHETQ
ncbi:MAG: hemolysin family protein [Kangiella sp.]|nr:hemolysin family protein [Kangiella sp.]MCW9027336.1 hemolysin family protein [Kangiella sp.]